MPETKEATCSHAYTILWDVGAEVYFVTEIDLERKSKFIEAGFLDENSRVLKVFRRCVKCEEFEEEVVNEIFSV
jgi:hypothetical protein